ncbi:unnamed protein product [Mytilus coruscus]|uniref:Mutator-like transposase domain-containing protein n=1 Tax=Mytilus coruscus TaxID=42192 RepID=A0A6J8DEX4_MYTCO|nr:unnamed protein product [Mytilus coruscus]
MESSTGASLMENIEEMSGFPVDVLIMDDDAASLSRVKEALDHENITKCFSYAIQQNKNNETKLKETLTAIVPHSFGIHDKCGNWCNKSIENNFHKYLPHGKPLTDDALRQDVQIIFDTVANNAERLAPAGSTKDIESTNNIYASKAPKRFCFSKSENLKTRLVTEEIPGIKQKPALLSFSSFTGSCILFDLETSSLKLDSGILQIAALNTVSGDTFNTYIQPNKSKAPNSSAVTGLTANGNILFSQWKNLENQDELEFSFSVESIAENMKYDKIVKDDAENFGDLVKGKYMSAQIAFEKIDLDRLKSRIPQWQYFLTDQIEHTENSGGRICHTDEQKLYQRQNGIFRCYPNSNWKKKGPRVNKTLQQKQGDYWKMRGEREMNFLCKCSQNNQNGHKKGTERHRR